MGKKIAAAAVVLICLAGRAEPSTPLGRLEREFRNIQSVLRIPGMSIAVAKDEAVIWTRAFGWSDIENRVRATPDTLYPIGSLTKPMAATLALRLLEERRLGLDDPLLKYHKDFQTDRVRVRHILTHTAGIAPGGRSGDRYEYSGSWFGYLAAVIGKAGGEPYRDQFVSRILEPLHMTDSIPGMDLLESKDLRRLAKPYVLKGGRIVLAQYLPTFFGSSA
jgi:CubicO group peptidase (beta-lactamase class C family)